MKLRNAFVLAVVYSASVHALAQSTHAASPVGVNTYDPSKGPLPPERRFVMTREGADEARYNMQNPASAALAQVATPPARRSYALPERAPRTVVAAPDWFVRLPDDTEEMMFAVGTAVSSDEQMAYDKARMHAERKLVESMLARIATQTRFYRADNTGAAGERFQQVTRKNARGELVGAQRVDSQVTHDGQNYKVYVLLRLPLGNANSLQTQRAQARADRETELRAQAAERDMDVQDAQEDRRQQTAESQLRQRLAPLPVPAPAPAAAQPVAPAPAPAAPGVVVTPLASPAANSTNLQLLDVDNEEYKRRRDEALQKPGAVVGRITVQ